MKFIISFSADDQKAHKLLIRPKVQPEQLYENYSSYTCTPNCIYMYEYQFNDDVEDFLMKSFEKYDVIDEIEIKIYEEHIEAIENCFLEKLVYFIRDHNQKKNIKISFSGNHDIISDEIRDVIDLLLE